jgi:hypothetical protein
MKDDKHDSRTGEGKDEREEGGSKGRSKVGRRGLIYEYKNIFSLSLFSVPK